MKDGNIRAEVEGIYEVVRDTAKLSNGTYFTPLLARKSFFVSGIEVELTEADKSKIAWQLEELVRKKRDATEGLTPISKFFDR